MPVAGVQTTTMQSAATATGNGTALDVTGLDVAALQVTISNTATITFEGTVDGSTWVSVPALNISTGTAATTATASGVYEVGVSSLVSLRARISAYTSGSVTVTGIGTNGILSRRATASGSTSDPEITKALRSSTGTKSNVSGAATSTTILASNANRLGMSVYNDSSAVLYLDTTGGTASATSFSVIVQPGGYYEMPFNYTGLVTGIWASATGTARVVEYT